MKLIKVVLAVHSF